MTSFVGYEIGLNELFHLCRMVSRLEAQTVVNAGAHLSASAHDAPARISPARLRRRQASCGCRAIGDPPMRRRPVGGLFGQLSAPEVAVQGNGDDQDDCLLDVLCVGGHTEE